MSVWMLPCEEVFNNALFYEDCCDLPPKPLPNGSEDSSQHNASQKTL